MPRTSKSLAKQEHSQSRLGPPGLLCFFRRPNITRTLNNNLSVEIEFLQGSPGLSYIRFYNGENEIFMPLDLEFIDLDAGCVMQHMTDLNDKPVYILSDTSWCALCSQEEVLAYIHAAGIICSPDEVIECQGTDPDLSRFDFWPPVSV